MPGSHKEIPGINTISVSPNKNAIMKGTASFAILLIGKPEILEATNKLIATGGVTIPIARLIVITTPK